jgi:transposase
MMTGIVEADETYIGGKASNMHKGKRKVSGTGVVGKTPIVGILERGGSVQAKVITAVNRETLIPNIMANVSKGATICTDELHSYSVLKQNGFNHLRVAHGAREYVRGNVHTNSIEGFWSQLKRSINGTFHHVSAQHLQSYVNEFVYRYNLQKSELPIFHSLSAKLGELHA